LFDFRIMSTPMNTTSLTLLEKLRNPAPNDAWMRFVHLYTPVLFNWAGRAGLQESDAADLVQEVFVILLEKLPEFQHDRTGSFRAWLRAVTMNKLRDWKRRAARAVTVAFDDKQFAEIEAEADSFWDLDFRRELTLRALELMKAEFAPTTWQACWEFLTKGKSAAEVAKQFGISENAVYIAKCRTMRRLRQQLQGMFD
jgi:RNA polymerase sigma-70 factor, ECF subfamily